MTARKLLLSTWLAFVLMAAAVPSIAFAQEETATPEATESAPVETPATYVVQPGDTLSSIARQYGLDVTNLLNLNPEVSTRPEWVLFNGETIQLLATATPEATETEAATETPTEEVTSVAPAVNTTPQPETTATDEAPTDTTDPVATTVATTVATQAPATGSSVDGSGVATEGQTILQILSADARFSTFVGAVERGAFADLLSVPGDLTVFAPTNDAFLLLTAEQQLAQLGDVGRTDNTLAYHVIAGGFSAAELITLADANGEVTTLNQDKLRITNNNGIAQVNGITIAIRDIQASNGVLHIVETVLNPAQKALLTGPSEGSLVSTGDGGSTVPVATASPVTVSIPTTVAVPSTPDAPTATPEPAATEAPAPADPPAETAAEAPAVGGAGEANVAEAAQTAALSGDTYVIQQGDSLRTIAFRSNTTVAYLLALNPELRQNPDLIFPGRSVRLSGPLPGAPFGTTSYIVQQFDTLGKIAARYGVTVADMVEINPQLRQREANIYIGEIINVPSN